MFVPALVVTNRKEFTKFGKTCVNALGRGEHLGNQVLGNKVHCFVWRDGGHNL